MTRILVAEDDAGIADFIMRGFRLEGYLCEVADHGSEAFIRGHSGEFDMMILDLGLPGMDGTDILEQLRILRVTMPIIVLTARTGLNDRVRALEGGADDYMAKPFQFAELLARVKLRLEGAGRTAEGTAAAPVVLRRGELDLDPRTQKVRVGGVPRSLSRRESDLLQALMRHPGQILSRAQLLSMVWDMDFDPGSNVVDVYVRALRKKIGADRIETVRGVGYRLA
ncbi:response regulator transcription factor [Corynebacterium kalidii]|uniref:Response regulator transcription factor n=1 Tax=Corynebacterium kalidii TaxID=2931982 RepID=A0A9X1WF96_9CORY|nr:response regulator transcription factor [Corynebacterium kalidii]MCJ7857585.1 response regulator transcription factor [Corynebacterium kalidii]